MSSAVKILECKTPSIVEDEEWDATEQDDTVLVLRHIVSAFESKIYDSNGQEHDCLNVTLIDGSTFDVLGVSLTQIKNLLSLVD